MTNTAIEYRFMNTQIRLILKCLIDGTNFEYFYRTRALFQFENVVPEGVASKLCLNEVFAAEKDVSTVSIYRLTVDGRDIARFKSSGIIISTGTGSSGWLNSARQITYQDVAIVSRIIGVDE